MALLRPYRWIIKAAHVSRTRSLLALAFAAALLWGCAAEQARSVPLADGSPATPANSEPSPAVAPTMSSTVQAHTSLPEPCTLLTQADLAGVLADRFQTGEAGELPAGTDAAFI